MLLRNVLMGVAAGAVGTAALNVTTYLDMTIRGRPSSDVPAQTARKLVAVAGVDLDPSQHQQETADNRSSGLGALLGYVAGLGVGAVYGLVRPFLGDAPLALTSLSLAAGAQAAGDLPSIATGATNPTEWGVSGWLADAVPHLVYGLVTAVAYEAFTAGPLGRHISPPRYAAEAARHSSASWRR